MWIVDGVVKPREIGDVGQLLSEPRGFTWIDVPEWDEAAAELLGETLRLHPLALEDCRKRSHVPKLHAYPGYLFMILHTPELGEPGHVHLLELDIVAGPNFFVTVHGPLGEGVTLESALVETKAIRQKIEQGRFRPETTAGLAHALGSTIARRQEAFVSDLASKIASLERRIVTETARDPQDLLEDMFRVRHELLTVRTMSSQSAEIFGRITTLAKFLPTEAHELVDDLHDQFHRVSSICEGEKEFLQGVLDYYQSRVTTKINVAMERLALIAAVALPVSAIAGIYGMNLIVPSATDPLHIAGVLFFMLLVTVGMLRYARRQGWW